jgi:hypothetical protein
VWTAAQDSETLSTVATLIIAAARSDASFA